MNVALEDYSLLNNKELIEKLGDILKPIEDFKYRPNKLNGKYQPISEESQLSSYKRSGKHHVNYILEESFIKTIRHMDVEKLPNVNRVIDYIRKNCKVIPLNPLFYANDDEFEKAVIKRLISDLAYLSKCGYGGSTYQIRLLREGVIVELKNRNILLNDYNTNKLIWSKTKYEEFFQTGIMDF